MSSFTGKFREYPLISADNFEKENLDSLAFFLSHCHKDHMSGLDSSAFHQRLLSSRNVFVYCSETTKNLLECDISYNHLKDYIHSIPMEQQTIIQLVNDDTRENESVCVTLLPAGHCVGSVMFLFEGQNGTVLYTGDFRLAKGDARRISLLHSNGSVKDIKSIYVDTTFCLPKMVSLPSREQSRDAIIEIMDRWFSRGPEYAVSLLCKGMYGFEFLLKELALNYQTKIHVSVERLSIYKCLPDMTSYFTTDGKSTRIHACKWKSQRDCKSDLPCGSSIHPSVKTKVLRIKPTSMWVARDTEPMPADFKRYNKAKRMWRVVHSMHASMEEIQDLVAYLRPYHVYPNVPPAGLDTLQDAFQRLQGFTRLQECDSCNKEDEEADRWANGLTKNKEEAKQSKLLEFAGPVPNEEVLAQCKELGLNEDIGTAPPRKRRRDKLIKPSVAPEEKASIVAETSPQTDKEQRDIANVGSTKLTGSDGGQIVQILPRVHREQRNSLSIKSLELCGAEESRAGPCQDHHQSQEKYSLDELKVERDCLSGASAILPEIGTEESSPQWKQLEANSFLNHGDILECRTTDKSRNQSEFRTTSDFLSLVRNDRTMQEGEGGNLSIAVTNSHVPPSLDPSFLTTGVADFDLPPSPGHVEPHPNRLSLLHQRLQSGESLSCVDKLKF